MSEGPVDEHVERVCAPLMRGWGDFVVGRATLADLSRLAGQARHALDSSAAPLPHLLWVAELEWLALHDEGGRESDEVAARRYLDPILQVLEHRV
jgi:hypothetical protein